MKPGLGEHLVCQRRFFTMILSESTTCKLSCSRAHAQKTTECPFVVKIMVDFAHPGGAMPISEFCPLNSKFRFTPARSRRTLFPMVSLIIPDKWQQDAVSLLREGKDVVVQAPTGAGKTYVFELLYESLRGQAIYTVPTRA